MFATLVPVVQAVSAAALVGLGVGAPLGQSTVQPAHPVIRPDANQGQPLETRTEDVSTIDGVMRAFYESTSGPAGQPRDWDRLRSLCGSETRFLAARPGNEGRSVIFSMTIEDYIMHNRRYFEKGGFYESEAARRVEEFGNIAHVWSTFESRRTEDAPEPYVRGIYSLQLLRDGDRWWILSVLWDHERPEAPLPEKYMQSPEE